ncbi:SMC-Scp complex subunit ScpB [Micromonospora rhizosphaerae]
MESVAPAPVPGERTEPAAAPAASAEPAGPPGDSAEPAAGPGEGAEPAAGPGDGAEPAAGPGDGAESAATPGESLADAAPAGEGAAAGVPSRQPAGRRRATPAPEPAPELDDAELRGALEAILLVVDEPVSELTLAQVLEQPAERIGPMLDEIAAGYTAAGHGFELRRAAGGWRLYTRPEYASYVERFVLDGQSVRLTQAALETLAVVAYKQPVTRSRISAIRGVNCDGVIRTLVSRGLVEECGTEPDSGAFLYRTTTMFLEKLGLNSVDDLPPLAPFLPDDVEDLADATR